VLCRANHLISCLRNAFSPEVAEKCGNVCETCNVKYMAGFDIKEKVPDISRIKGVTHEFLKA
jgi:hypothetical protein